jgi:arginyl-tRNA synthetase
MALAKARKMNPRQLAADVAAKLDISEWCEPVEVAGAGFLNFRLKPFRHRAGVARSGRRAASCFFRKLPGRDHHY